MKIQRIKTKIIAAVTAGVVMLSLVAAGAINVVRSTFAASENFELTKSGDVEIDGNVKQVSVYLKASKAGTLLSMNGDFLEKIEENNNLYFGLESITASDKVKDMVQDSTFADGIFVLSNGEAELAAGETILTATYRVMTATPVGRYQLSANIEAANVNGVGYEDESVSVEVAVSRGKNVPDVAFQETAASVVYGSTLNNAVVGTWEGTPVYAVENTSVATVNPETGLVTAVGVGNTRVSATFAETANYSGATIYYTLTVTPRAIAIMSANVQNKMYDGATGAIVSSVGFGDLVDGDLLEFGTDYSYEANFENANVGTGKQVNIVVSLRDTAKAKNYTLTDSTYKSYASIIPYVFSETVDGLAMESYEFAYTGEPVKPKLTVTAKLSGGDKVLVEGQDYDAEYLAVLDEDEDLNTGDLEHDVTNVGDKLVLVTGKGNFEGVLSKTYAVVKANSGNPAEMTEGLKAAVGTKLGDIAGERTNGFNWVDASTLVLKGENSYPATYVKNNDSRNYNVSEVSVPVYGLAKVNVEVGVTDRGGAIYSDKATAIEGEEVTITVEPDEGWYVFEVFVNGVDRTAELDNNKLVLVAGKEDILVTATFIKPYEVIQGDEQAVILGEDSNVVFKIDADYSLFNPGGAVFIDGEHVDEANYTSKSGSTIISLNREFVDTLGAGTHLLGVTFTDGGVAAAEFTIQTSEEDGGVSSPDTGAFTAEKGMVAGAIMLPVVLGVVAVIYMASKKKSKIGFDK